IDEVDLGIEGEFIVAEVEADASPDEEPYQRPYEAYRQTLHHENAENGVVFRSHGFENRDLLFLLEHDHDQSGHHIERRYEDDGRNHEAEDDLLNLKGREEIAIELGPVHRVKGASPERLLELPRHPRRLLEVFETNLYAGDGIAV